MLCILTTPSAQAQAQAQPVLQAKAQAGGIPVWPHVRVLKEAAGAPLNAEQALQRLSQFTVPTGAYANMGTQRHGVWLHFSLQQNEASPRGSFAAGEWLLDLAHPSISQMDLVLARDGHIVQQLRTGSQVLVQQRPLPMRSLALPLDLQPGVRYDVLLRLEHTGTILLPLRLYSAVNYHLDESRFQLGQGLLAGLGLSLLLYSLLQWASTREAMYLYYGASVAGITGFFAAYHGLAAQYFWPDDAWLMLHASLLFGMLTVVASFLFIDRALAVSRHWPRMSLLMRTLPLLCVLEVALFVAGVIPYRQALLFASVVSVLPMALAVPMAVARARQGEVAARFMLVGWAVYGAGVLSFSLLLRGLAPMLGWSVHIFQLSSVFEMFMWMAVLSAHTRQVRDQGRAADEQRQQAEQQSARMSSLALSDPLTALANRRGLEDMGARILQSSSTAFPALVLVLDLDNFKPINDTMGHDAGDELLAQVASRLRACMREGDCVARTGGDEFAVIAGRLLHEDEAATVAEKVRQQLALPYLVRGKACEVGVTVGYAVAPVDGIRLVSLMALADQALLEGKRHGKAQVRRGAGGKGGAPVFATRPAQLAEKPARATTALVD